MVHLTYLSLILVMFEFLEIKLVFVCYLSLKALKNSINDCLQMLESHICKCTYYKKRFKFDKIDKHICD